MDSKRIVSIIGTGSYVPEKVLTNRDLEAMVETSDEWIYSRTGMRERHIAAADQAASDLLLAEGVYVIGFSYPVVPKGKARIRTQMSAAHSREHLERAVAAFTKVGRELGVIQ